MRIDELKSDKDALIDELGLSNESDETKNKILEIIKDSFRESNRWNKRIQLAKIAEKEGWSEEQYDAECKKRNI
ncbi:MAG: hypothetical protein HC836_39985 [Richelia sp. RM2_1_2]|nr:hypothetical protein [Richelia sp. RM2_1_2]